MEQAILILIRECYYNCKTIAASSRYGFYPNSRQVEL